MARLLLRVTFISLVALITASCSKQFDSRTSVEPESERSAPPDANSAEGEESESQPSANEISEDCHAFVWSTKVMPAKVASAECPECPASGEGAQVLKFQAAQVERVSCAGETCEAAVRIHASFNPSKGGTISGGLTGWIPPEQREQYSRGQTPPGKQVYHVEITYRREGERWRPVDFGFGLTNAQ
jgi:hypothetical protein